MGNKYASLHIYGDNKNEIIELLKENYADKVLDPYLINYLNEKKINNPEGYKRFISRLSQRYGNIIMVKYDKCISIFDEYNSFETIHNKAKILSQKVDSLITYTSNFDDDIFVIGIYKAGKLITSGKFGVGLSAYGMKQKDINVDQICKVLHINKTESLCSVNSLENVSCIEDMIQENLKITLNLVIEEVELDKSYVEMYSDNSYHIYKKDC